MATNIVFDNSDSNEADVASSLSITSFALGGGSNRGVYVFMGTEGGPQAHNGVTFDGVAMTQVDSPVTEGVNRCSWWYILESQLPTSGNYAIQGSLGGNAQIQLIAIALENVAQQAPENFASETDTNASVISQSITTLTPTAWVLDGVNSGDGVTFTPGTGQTEREDLASANSASASSTKEVETAGSTTMEQTPSSTANRLLLYLISIAPDDPPIAGGQGPIWFMFENARSKWDEIFKPRGYNEPILVPEAI